MTFAEYLDRMIELEGMTEKVKRGCIRCGAELRPDEDEVCKDCEKDLNVGGIDKADVFLDITDQMYETYEAKNHDYDDAFGKMYEKFGIVSSAIRLTDKYNRFMSLIDKDSKVKDESIEDTLLDMANYAIMTIIEMRFNKYEKA